MSTCIRLMLSACVCGFASCANHVDCTNCIFCLRPNFCACLSSAFANLSQVGYFSDICLVYSNLFSPDWCSASFYPRNWTHMVHSQKNISRTQCVLAILNKQHRHLSEDTVMCHDSKQFQCCILSVRLFYIYFALLWSQLKWKWIFHVH